MSELIIDKNSDGEYTFTKGGRQLDSKELDCPRARKVKEHALVASELVSVKSWLIKVKALNDEFTVMAKDGMTEESQSLADDIRAYYTSATITYQKYFTKCHGVSITPLKADKIFSKEQLELHKRVEDIRNKFSAHVDHSDLFTHDLYALYDPKNEFQPSIIPVFNRHNHLVDDVLEDFINLVDFLVNQQHESYKKAGQALMDKEFGGK
ncbi:hypothetical protein G5Y06_004536 [Vibrio parahaemolyticus]|nr:hypothetical protein [Vibrio parahaemolyticus]